VSVLVPLVHCAAGSEPGGDAGPRDVHNTDAGDAGSDDTGLTDAGSNDTGASDTGSTDAGDMDASDANDTGSGDDASGAPTDVMHPDVCVPRTEVCNGIDDDCNGMIDETGCPGHLLVSEVVLAPNAAEFVEIYNPTDHAIDLSNVYVTDTALYPRMIDATSPPAVDASDFAARFPAGAMIASHGYQTVATGNPSAWPAEFAGACPTYYLQSTATVGTCLSAQVMRPLPVGANSIGMTATLTNSGEPITLFTWDGMSDLVHDIDYAYVGAPTMSGATVFNEAVDKSMLFVDGPDPDTMRSGYALDTPVAMQSFAPVPVVGGSAVRCVIPMETGETLLGGNGVFGHNETSEHLATTWTTTTPATSTDGGLPTTYDASPNAANHCP
jgi:hypothetical protein